MYSTWTVFAVFFTGFVSGAIIAVMAIAIVADHLKRRDEENYEDPFNLTDTHPYR